MVGAIKHVTKAGPCQGGHAIAVRSNNVMALSWMSLAARTPDPLSQGLAQHGAALCVAAPHLHVKLIPIHTQGVLNNKADALSQ